MVASNSLLQFTRAPEPSLILSLVRSMKPLTFVTCALLLIVVAARSGAHAFFPYIFTPMPSSPRAAEIGEIMFERSDVSAPDEEYLTIPHDEFLRFFTDGEFRNDVGCSDHVHRSGTFPALSSPDGKGQLCSGAFATKDGHIFAWSYPSKRVLQLHDAQRRTGWLILPPK